MRDPSSISNGLVQKCIGHRHFLHAHPELGYDLHRTAKYVSDHLTELGIPHETGIAETGIVAQIRGKNESANVVGFRADMDALPITEETNVDYASIKPGRMHACGHDGHTAILLGVAEHLNATRDFDGTVRLIFQPAEEGQAGARRMIDEGLFERFPIDQVFALHNWPDLPPGVVGTQRGPIMAASYLVRITLVGRGGHGAMPHQFNPLMSVAAHIQLALNTYLAQMVNSQRSIVISLTQIQSTDAINALPDQVQMIGAVRILHRDSVDRFMREVKHLIQATAQAFGAKAEIEFDDGYPITLNNPASTEIVERAALNLGMHIENEQSGLDPSMASEDFSFMLETCPGSYFWLGQGGGSDGRSLHSSSYDFNDKIISSGIALFAEIARTAHSRKNAVEKETTGCSRKP